MSIFITFQKIYRGKNVLVFTPASLYTKHRDWPWVVSGSPGTNQKDSPWADPGSLGTKHQDSSWAVSGSPGTKHRDSP